MIGPIDFDVAVIVYTSVTGSRPVSSSWPACRCDREGDESACKGWRLVGRVTQAEITQEVLSCSSSDEVLYDRERPVLRSRLHASGQERRFAQGPVGQSIVWIVNRPAIVAGVDDAVDHL